MFNEEANKPNYKKLKIGILLIIIFSIIQYLLQIEYSIEYYENINPSGDSFTYELGHYIFFDFINNNSFIDSLLYIINGQWYWSQRFLVLLTNFFLTKNIFNFSLINYLAYCFSSLIIFIFLYKFNINFRLSFLFSLSIWIFPINYHFFDYASLLNSGLDSVFVASLYCVIFSFFLALNNLNNFKYLFLFHFCFIFSLSARGNSLPIILIVIFIPFLKILFNLIKKKNSLSDLVKLLFIPIIFTFFYFYKNYKNLYLYYSDFNFIKNPDFLNYFISYLKNIPGIFFYYPNISHQNLMEETNLIVFSLSIIIHLVLIYSLFIKKKISKNNLILRNTSIFTFYFFLLYGSITWNTPHINIYNALFIWSPIKVSITLIIIFYVFTFHDKIKNTYFILIFLVTVSLPSIIISNNLINDIKYYDGKRPEIVKEFADLIYNHKDESPIILYTEPNFISNRLIDFYLMQDDKKPLSWFRDKYPDDIWNPTKKDKEYIKRINLEIESVFKNSGLIIIPISSKAYHQNDPKNIILHGFFRYYSIITDNLKKSNLNEFSIIKTYKTKKTTLVVLERSKENLKNFKLNFSLNEYEIILL